MAKLLYHLPRAVLSAIIAVNLISLFRKYPEAYRGLYLKKKYTELILFGLTNLGFWGEVKFLKKKDKKKFSIFFSKSFFSQKKNLQK